MSGGYPWSVLGIGPTDEAGEIRRAYARRLRSVRPDENAEAFQELVQARDLALRLASHSQRPRGIGAVSFELERPGGAVTTINVSFEEAPPPPPPPPPPEPQPPLAPLEPSRPETVLLLEPDARSESRQEQRQEPAPEPQPQFRPPEPRAPGPRAPALRRRPPPPVMSPQGVIDAARAVFASPALEGWPEVMRRLGELSQTSRAAVETTILQLAARYARENRSGLTRMGDASQAFFALLAALNSEFGWRERDRIIYSTLSDAVEADAFVVLLDRAYRQPRRQPELIGAPEFAGLDSDAEGLTPDQRRDRYYFFDQNSDAQGLSICRKMLSDPNFQHHWDAFGSLFVPTWPRNFKGVASLLISLLGWSALLLAFEPSGYWILPLPVTYLLLSDVHFSEPPRSKIGTFIHDAVWNVVQVAYAVLIAAVSLAWLQSLPPDRLLWLYALFPVVFGYCAYAVTRLLLGATEKRREEHPGWDRKALFFFPVVAAARGYYVRFAVGLLAWLALVSHGALSSVSFFWTGEGDLGHLILILLVLTLHISAGYNSGRWLLLRFFSVVRTADRKHMFDPELRAAFLLEKGTRKKNQQQKQQSAGSRGSWWWIVLLLWLLGHLIKAISQR